MHPGQEDLPDYVGHVVVDKKYIDYGKKVKAIIDTELMYRSNGAFCTDVDCYPTRGRDYLCDITLAHSWQHTAATQFSWDNIIGKVIRVLDNNGVKEYRINYQGNSIESYQVTNNTVYNF